MRMQSFFRGGIVPGTVRALHALVADANKKLDVLNIGSSTVDALDATTFSMATVAVAATAAELNSAADDSARFTAVGAALSVTAVHNKRTLLLATAAGSVATLPPATGSGLKFKFLVTALATSNSHIVKVGDNTDVFIGIIRGARVDSSNAVLAFAAAADSDTITLDRTNGSVSKGEWIEVEDVALNTWSVTGFLTSTGAAFATPFSATV